ncbi:hypothetical protein ACTJJJ_25995 [Dyadobacter sp. 22481]
MSKNFALNLLRTSGTDRFRYRFLIGVAKVGSLFLSCKRWVKYFLNFLSPAFPTSSPVQLALPYGFRLNRLLQLTLYLKRKAPSNELPGALFVAPEAGLEPATL